MLASVCVCVCVCVCVRALVGVGLSQETMHKCPLDRKGKHLLVLYMASRILVQLFIQMFCGMWYFHDHLVFRQRGHSEGNYCRDLQASQVMEGL